MTIEEMRDRRDALVAVSRDWGRNHEFYRTEVRPRVNRLYKYCAREIVRYNGLIEAAVIEIMNPLNAARLEAEARRNDAEDNSAARQHPNGY